MNWRWLGLTLLLISLIAGVLMAGNIKITTFQRTESYVKTDDNKELNGTPQAIVQVPPWNSTEGWIGFNVTLHHKGKIEYEAFGQIKPADGDPEPDVAMRAVNLTGIQLLRFGQFEPPTWNSVKVYAEADLFTGRPGIPDQLVDNFIFHDLDDGAKYVVLFRGYKNESRERPILINLKERWYENISTTLLEPTAPNLTATVLTAVVGLVLVTRRTRPPPKRRLKRRTVR